MTRPLLVRSHLTGLVRVVRGGRGARLREHALAFHAHDPRGRAHTCTRTRTRTVASRALCRPRSEPALAPSQVSSRCCPEPGHLCLEPAAGERARQGGREGGSLGRPASHVALRLPGLAGPSLHHVHSPQGPGPELLICFPPGLMVRDLYAPAPLRHFNQALGGASGAEPGAAAPMGSVGHCPHPPSCWGPAPSVGGEPRSPFMGFMGTDTAHRGALSAPTGGQALVSGSRPGKAPSIPASGGCWVPWGTVRGGRGGGQLERVVTMTGARHRCAWHCLALSVGQVSPPSRQPHWSALMVPSPTY